MGDRKLTKANQNSFKPVIDPLHSKTFKWLVDSGYTLSYLAIVLDIPLQSVSNRFRNTQTLSLHQICVIIKLLEGKYTINDVLTVLLRTEVKIDESIVKDVYASIQLPDVGNVQVYRTDFEPKKPKNK